MSEQNGFEEAIAIIGMAGRFPGAATVAELWERVRSGHEARVEFTEAQLRACGVDPALLGNPDFVRAGMKFDGLDQFDAAFFGFSNKQAQSLDPQQRLFLECAWEAFEDAGYHLDRYHGQVGVFAGAGTNTYMLANIRKAALTRSRGTVPSLIDSEKDYLATRVSYKLGLTGPSLSVQTACSSSLVAVHLACQSLLNLECDMALAGGVSAVAEHLGPGYLYVKDGIYSADGHCRAFDQSASGTVFASGVAGVVLKRLGDALRDGDAIRAVIRGTAINNDGAAKAGYSAPSVAGQARVIAMAQAMAGVEPAVISCIEAHGTGTVLGDAIELAALQEVFGTRSEVAHRCALGSIKSNIGHLDAAAGVAGLIKVVLCLQHRQLVPSVNFARPHPLLSSEDCAFFVNSELRPWQVAPGQSRYAGVSSFGIGGTNAHAIVAEAPTPSRAPSRMRPRAFVFSARSADALRVMADRFEQFLRNGDAQLADVAHTLLVGRKPFEERVAIIAASRNELLEQLRAVPAVLQTSTGSARVLMARETGGEPAALREAARQWCAGVDMACSSLAIAMEPARRVAMPTYPFEHQRHWMDHDTQESLTTAAAATGAPGKLPLEQWFNIPSWRVTLAPPPWCAGAADAWLVFSDGSSLCRDLIARLQASQIDTQIVTIGTSFEQLGPHHYCLDPQTPAHYQALITALLDRGHNLRRIAHCWSLGQPHDAFTLESFTAAQPHGCESVLCLAQALSTLQQDLEHSLVVVTDHLFEIGGEETCEPGKATLCGICKVIRQEAPQIRCTLLELPVSAAAHSAEFAERVLAEAVSDDGAATIAYRSRTRWVQCFEQTALAEPGSSTQRLREHGLYVLIGGLGSVGLTIAECLARDYHARLVLITRGSFPERTQWSELAAGPAAAGEAPWDLTRARVQRLLRIEAAGGTVMVMKADVSAHEALHGALSQAEAEFGPIDGVFHLAGEMRDASLQCPLRSLQRSDLITQARAKAYGLYALRRALRHHRPRFVLLFSSNASVLGGFGLGAYAAANAFLDRAAAAASSAATAWIATNWDRWLVTEIHTGADWEAVPQSFTAEQGYEAVRRILGIEGVAQVVVSNTSLEERLARWLEQRWDAVAPRTAAAAPVPTGSSGMSLERWLIQIWEDVLGTTGIGVDDNFLDLGGDSLIGLRVIARVRESLDIDISLRIFFAENPTVRSLMTEVEKGLAARTVASSATLDRTASLVAAG